MKSRYEPSPDLAVSLQQKLSYSDHSLGRDVKDFLEIDWHWLGGTSILFSKADKGL